mmetsp:Transcript_36278/g.107126  ORF Transcript_36278/g.107126 Transcript_36278/m.107126 type:complete len:105 (+) Transcript_36278:344-658(+)
MRPPTRAGCSSSCVTHTAAAPLSRTTRSTRRVEKGSRALVGSSSSSTSGHSARAIAIATRCAWPPESVDHAWLSTTCSSPISYTSAGRSARGRPFCDENCCAEK